MLLGHDLLAADRRSLQRLRQDIQIVFQDLASLDPRMRIGDIRTKAWNPAARHERGARGPWSSAWACRPTRSAAIRTSFPAASASDRHRPRAGGRAKVLICDEPTSALDVSVQAQILDLLNELQEELGIAYLFITHNFGVVEYLADRIAVMDGGRIVELDQADAVLHARARK